jgi:formylglycine-generating enzyme required for sulfatase activity
VNLPSFLFCGFGLGIGLAISAATLSAAEPRTIVDLKLTLLPIPAGTFTMGSPPAEKGHSDDESPLTRVTITRPFWLGQTEVTHAQWRALMGTDLFDQARRVLVDDTRYQLGGQTQTLREYFGADRDGNPKDMVYNASDDAPMYWVSWEDAVAFCRKLTERERAENETAISEAVSFAFEFVQAKVAMRARR